MDKGVLGNIGNVFANLGGGAMSLAYPLVHPVKTAQGIGAISQAMASPQLGAQFAENMIKPHLKQPGETPGQYAGRLGGEATTGVGQILGAKGLGEIGSAAGDVAGYLRPKSLPSIVAPSEAAAEKLGQAILPPGGLTPKILRSIEREAPAVREYAGRTGNPLNTQAEGIKAAQGVANEGLAHFNENILGPNKDVRVDLPNNVSPTLRSTATLEQVSKRISDINDVLRAASGKSEGATLTAIERTGLESEVKALRGKLYDTLAEKTGMPADDIQELREGYGGQYTLADALQSARMARLGRIGAASQGVNAVGVPRPNLWEIPNTVWKSLRGGEEAIANRQFRSRIGAFEPSAPARLMPNPPAPRPYVAGPDVPPRPMGPMPSYDAPRPPTPSPLNDINGPMRPITEVPELNEALKASQALEGRANAAYAAERMRLAEQLRQSRLREQQMLAKAREQQNLARTIPGYREGAK
jgi:hypothetical protein